MADVVDPFNLSAIPGNDILAQGVTSVVMAYIGLVRQDIGAYALTTGLRELEGITPRSSRPSEYPSIRPYYPVARLLRGLDVRANWEVLPQRYDTSDGSGGFVVLSVMNPHPGAATMMFGSRSSFYQYAHIPNPNSNYFESWPRKTKRRAKRTGSTPTMMTNWQTLAGKGHWFHRGVFVHPRIAPRPGFAEAVYNIARKWSTDAATRAFQSAQNLQYVPARTWIPGLDLYVVG